jgi:hypothetical protein
MSYVSCRNCSEATGHGTLDGAITVRNVEMFLRISRSDSGAKSNGISVC